MTKKYLIIDGNYLLHRSYWAIRDMYGPKNEPVNAVYGFFSTFVKLLDWSSAEGIAVAFDAGKPQFRTEKIPQYKASREKMPDELYLQLSIIQEILEQSGVASYALKEYEADDIIATFAQKMSQDGSEVLIFSSDMDLYQLLTEKISIIRTDKFRNYCLLTPEEFEKKWTITPEQILDYKALRGDSSDQIPGVPGVGEKTAIKLINEYGNLDSIYDNVEDIKGAVQKKLVDNKDLAYISREVATLIKNVPYDEIDCSLHALDFGVLEQDFQKYTFYTLIKRLERFIKKQGLRNDIVKKKVSVTPGVTKESQDGSQLSLF